MTFMAGHPILHIEVALLLTATDALRAQLGDPREAGALTPDTKKGPST